MASVKSKKAPAKLKIAIDSFVSSALAGGPFSVAYGATFRADHPIVKAVPSFFADADVDTAELSRLRSELHKAALPPPEPRVPVVPAERRLRDADALVSIANGERVRKGSPAAKQRPEWFVPVIPAGVSRSDALVATAPMRILNPDGTTARIVYAGQMVDREDEFVRLHPELFGMPPLAGAGQARTAKATTRTEA